MFDFVNKLFAQRNKPRQAKGYQPTFDALESRQLMSVTSVTLNAAGLLRVVADAGNNIVTIAPQSPLMSSAQNAPVAPSSPTAHVSGLTMSSVAAPSTSAVGAPSTATVMTGGAIVNVFNSITVKDLTDDHVWFFRQSAVKRIEVDAGNGDNTIQSSVNVPTRVVVGDGNNDIQTGAAADTIIAGNGNNVIATNDGNDVIRVGNGNNMVDGGNGNDTIGVLGGTGDIFGGAGNDTITNAGTTGAGCLIYGQDGNDVITTHNRNDAVDGGAGYDRLSVPGDTLFVRNGENVVINNVPLAGPAKDFGKFSALTCANRVLQADGYPTQPSAILDDSTYGCTPATLCNVMQQSRPDTTYGIGYGVQDLIDVVQSGKPALIPICRGDGYKTWVVVNGFDSATQTFKIVERGVQMTLTAANLFVQWSRSDFGRAMVY